MSIKRRDNKNRILRNGESQRKDGRYCYKYLDAAGKSRYVYSWKLEASDKLPRGKRDCAALREKEREIFKDIQDGILNDKSGITATELFENYISLKSNAKFNTKSAYHAVLVKLQRHKFGSKRIRNITTTEAKAWLMDMKKEGYKYHTILGTKTVMSSVFKAAVEDNIIRKNPFDFSINTIISNDTEPREALTDEQEQSFLSFIKNNKEFIGYYTGVFILLNTGLRISEFAGLTLDSIDMTNRVIAVEHQLQHGENGKYQLTALKTKSGRRKIPMSDEVYECLEQQIELCKSIPHIHSAQYLFFTKNDSPVVSNTWQRRFAQISKKYNQEHPEKPLRVTPHICRHTFCSKLMRNGVPIKEFNT